MSPRARGTLILLGSLLVGLVAMFVAVHSTGGGHGSYFLAKALFPFTMLSASPSTGLPAWALAVALLQFPAYGAALASGTLRGSIGRAALLVGAVHLLAALVAFFVVPNDAFPN